jgi:class 3 adenylate cyclase/tetratricopeptide (TPR) repeat protein
MHNVIPGFISERVSRCGDVPGGSLCAPTMFVDIARFTSITEDLMKKGKQGAEDLSILINRIYEPLIEAIHARGGFITNFAGDAVTAVFPHDSGAAALSSAERIMEGFSRRRHQKDKYSGGKEMKARIGLAGGEIAWRIFGKERKAFCFHGPAIEECARVTKGREAGRIYVSESFRQLKGGHGGSPEPRKRVRPTIAGMFYPPEVLRARPGGEFRNVTTLFLGLRRADMEKADDIVSRILSKTGEYGGYFNGMFFDDKGPHLLVVFGAPVSYENNHHRALSLALELRACFKESIRTGITSGTAFAGVVGSSRRCTYTVLGDCVNTAARIMQNACWGSVCQPGASPGRLPRKLLTCNPRELSLEGKKLPLGVVDVECFAEKLERTGFSGPLVGRGNELAQLGVYLEPLTRESFAGVTYVYGEPGVGKSRLLSDLMASLPDYRCFTMQTDGLIKKSLGPFTHLLKEYFGQVNASGEAGGEAVFEEIWHRLICVLEGLPDRDRAKPVILELQRTRSLLAAMLGYFSHDSLHSQLDARGRFDNTLLALKTFFKAQSLIAPSVFLLEDLHWLDTDSITALKTITLNVGSFPFAIAASSRLFDDGSMPELELDDNVAVNRMTLEPLEGRKALELAEARLSWKLSGELSAFIIERAQGNPFYIEQFCRYLEENSLLCRRSGMLFLSGNEPDIPESIGAVIVARIDRLSGKLKELVQTAAVLGREFNVQVLSRMLRGSGDTLHSLLEEGEKEAIWSALNEVLYIFSHTMLREVAYDMQLGRQLQELHGLAARAMEMLYGNTSGFYADIAYHYEKAQIIPKTVEYLRRAVDYATREYRNQEAVNLLRRLIAYRGAPEDRIETELEMLHPLVRLGKWADAEEIIRRNSKIALELSLDDSYADCCRHHAALEHRRGNNGEAIGHLEAAWEHYVRVGDEKGLMESRSVRANINMVIGNFDRAQEDLEESIRLAEATGNMDFLAMNTSDLGNVYLYRYQLDEAERLLKRAREIAVKCGNMRVEANTVNNLGVVEYHRRNYDECRRYLDEYVSISERVGDRESMTHVLGNIGVMHEQKGDLDDAMSCYTRQLSMARELGITYSIAFSMRQIGHVHWVRGDYSGALDWMTRSLETTLGEGDPRNRAQTVRDIGRVYFDMGRLEKGREYLEKAVDLSAGMDKDVHISILFSLAKLSAKEGRHKEAAEHVESLIAIRREIGEELQLLDSLLDCSEIMLFTGHEKRAGEMLVESGELTRRLNSHDMVPYLEFEESLFQALSDPPEAERRLTELLKVHTLGESFSAQICFHLYRITGGEGYRESAIRLYSELYSKVPDDDFREKLEFLGKTQRHP